ADEVLYGKPAAQSRSQPEVVEDDEEFEERERATRLARALLEASLCLPDEEEEEDMVVKEEDQRSLSVGIIGAPNAGKSCLTNFMVKLWLFYALDLRLIVALSYVQLLLFRWLLATDVVGVGRNGI
ncbi:hypothetical protein GW17_00002523, partial [Ensete ventricosum]